MKKYYKQFRKNYPQFLIILIRNVGSISKDINKLSTYPHI